MRMIWTRQPASLQIEAVYMPISDFLMAWFHVLFVLPCPILVTPRAVESVGRELHRVPVNSGCNDDGWRPVTQIGYRIPKIKLGLAFTSRRWTSTPAPLGQPSWRPEWKLLSMLLMHSTVNMSTEPIYSAVSVPSPFRLKTYCHWAAYSSTVVRLKVK